MALVAWTAIWLAMTFGYPWVMPCSLTGIVAGVAQCHAKVAIVEQFPWVLAYNPYLWLPIGYGAVALFAIAARVRARH